MLSATIQHAGPTVRTNVACQAKGTAKRRTQRKASGAKQHSEHSTSAWLGFVHGRRTTKAIHFAAKQGRIQVPSSLYVTRPCSGGSAESHSPGGMAVPHLLRMLSPRALFFPLSLRGTEGDELPAKSLLFWNGVQRQQVLGRLRTLARGHDCPSTAVVHVKKNLV